MSLDSDDDDDLLLELQKYSQYNPPSKNFSSKDSVSPTSSNQTNNNTTLVQLEKHEDSNNLDEKKQAVSQGFFKEPVDKGDDKTSALEVLIAKGEIAVLRSKLKALEVERDEERKTFHVEKEKIIKTHEQDLDTVKYDINKLQDEKQFLKLQLKSSLRMNNVAAVAKQPSSSRAPSVEDQSSESISTTTPKKKLKSIDKKTEKPSKGTRVKITFQNKSHIDENFSLLNKILKYKIPGLDKTSVSYLNSNTEFQNFESYAMNILSELDLNKYIESLLDYWLKKINVILNNENDSLGEKRVKYIPFILSVVLQIIKFRPSACGFDILINLFVVIKKIVFTFEYVFKSTTMETQNQNRHLQKYLVKTIDSGEIWKRLYPESEQSYNGNTPGAANPTTLAITNDSLVDDSLFEIPTFHTEFVDIVIIIYSFDVLEVISENLWFQIEKLLSRSSSTMTNEIIPTVCDKVLLVFKSFQKLYRLVYSISFQPIFQPIFNLCKILNIFLRISQSFKTNKVHQSVELLKGVGALIKDLSEWLIHINLNNFLKKLPSKYNISSLLRPIGEYDTNKNLVAYLDKIANNEMVYQPCKNNVVYIFNWNMLLTLQILDNVSIYLVLLMSSGDNDTRREDETEIINSVLFNVVKLLNIEYPLSLKQTGIDTNELNTIVLKSLQIIQHCHYYSVNQSHDENSQEHGALDNDNDSEQLNNNSKGRSILDDEKYKLELIVTLSRIVFQKQQSSDTLLGKNSVLSEVCRDILDSLITPDESDYIYEALTPAAR